MKLLIRCFLEQSPSLDLEETLAELTATLFKETDVDRSGDISLEEFASAFRRNEHLFKVLSLRLTKKELLFLFFFKFLLLSIIVQVVGFNRNQHQLVNIVNVH